MKKNGIFGFSFLVSVVLLGCGNNIEKDNFSETERELYSILPESYAKVGTEHNEMLADFYFGEENRAARNAGIHIEQVEAILDNLPDSLEEAKNAISTVELNSLAGSGGEVLLEFISYAETAKASLEFWSENIELLEGTENMEARWILKKLWNKYKHKLKMMAASDAAGAAAGAAVGAAIGAPIAGVGAGYGAAIGAAIAGSASSAEGFKKDCICIVIPLTKIQKKIN